MRRAALLVLALLALACREAPPPTRTADLPTGPEGYPPPDQVVESGQHVITREGVRKALLVSRRLYFYNQLGKVVGDTISVTFFNDDGGYESTLTAKTGELEQATQTMTARGDVVVVGTQSTIRTQALRYDPAAHQVSSDQPTEIIQGGNVIRGGGVVADPGLRNIRITRGSAVLRSEPALGTPPPAPQAPVEAMTTEPVGPAPGEAAPAPQQEPPPDGQP